MPTHHPKVLAAPPPTKICFDPFNSSSTGHQRAESRIAGSTSWKQSRQYKLAHQFRDTTGNGGTIHRSDLVGAGSEDFGKDGRKENGDWEKDAPGLRQEGWRDIRGLFAAKDKSLKRSREDDHGQDSTKRQRTESDPPNIVYSKPSNAITKPEPAPRPLSPASLQRKVSQPMPDARQDNDNETTASPPQIFRGLTMYLNGSTMTAGMSDHRLKTLFAQHGGNTSISLGRRTVTHVILGTQDAGGGGLSNTKFQKENREEVGGE
ncbi:hypothetical protein LTR66_015453 [Elasticomyces elasticus]|nr:hypothetical protein LTR66_015453 [Elasticomyces elasticus]